MGHPDDTKNGWLSLGWLTDIKLAQDIKIYKADLESVSGVRLSMSAVIRKLLRTGLEALRPTRNS